MMKIQAYPTIPIDLHPDQYFEYETGILHASSSDAPTINFQYWITKRSIIPAFVKDCQGAGYSVIYFTPFSNEVAWTCLYIDQPVTNIIFPRLTATDNPHILSCSSLM